ncbi:MAG TPA: hypothetical protein VLI39_06450 [Sedimentisphaerales bacterium]|nr:hypothetical protein [Sedimentisphaerales bacterium]
MKNVRKSVPIILLAVAIVVATDSLWLAWQGGVFPDFGVESGYYGQFNRVKHVIERMPGVRIVDLWMHKDVSIEDFGFVPDIDGGRTVAVDFSESSPQMAEWNKRRIREFVERQIAASGGMQP